MRNSSGFTLIESLVAISVLLIIMTTLSPIISLMMNERESLKQQQHIVNELHNELQLYLWDKQRHATDDYTKNVDGTPVHFRFKEEDQLLKGCVTWNNAADRSDEFCLYGFPKT